jgi:hypothetical protein
MTRIFLYGVATAGWMLVAAPAVLAENRIEQPDFLANSEFVAGQASATSEDFLRLAPAPVMATQTNYLNYVADSAGDHAEGDHGDHHAHGHDDHGHGGHGHDPHGLGGGGWHPQLHGCDPWTLKDYCDPCSEYRYGGWLQAGYHSETTGFSHSVSDLHDFNDVPDDINLNQGWLYFEKTVEMGSCSADWGYRADIVYGTDAQKIQASGSHSNRWDNSFDHGQYGWAIPQAYAQVAQGDWHLKLGHFLANVGFEQVPSVSNYFYSRSLGFVTSVPKTYTGVMADYHASECTTYQFGWVLGWDTGFDQYEDGNAFHGGVKHHLNDDVHVGYTMTAGNLGYRSGDEFGYSHSIDLVAHLNCRTTYVFQSDLVYTDGLHSHPEDVSEEYSIINYLFYELNSCWSAGGRVEWFKTNELGDYASFQEITGGLNYHPHANLVIRPEIRYDWTSADEAHGDDFDNRAIFGIDAILTF